MPNYPGSLDSLSNPTATTKRNAVGFSLSTVISTLNDIAEALEAKLGIGSSTAVNKSILNGNGTGSSTWATSPTVSGSGTFEGGVNVGAATGAATGEVKTSGAVKAGAGVYPSNQVLQNIACAGPLTVAAGATTTLAPSASQGCYLLMDAASGDTAIVALAAGAATVTTVGTPTTLGGAGFWNINSDAGSFWAVYASGGSYLVKNRTGAQRTTLYWFRLGGF